MTYIDVCSSPHFPIQGTAADGDLTVFVALIAARVRKRTCRYVGPSGRVQRGEKAKLLRIRRWVDQIRVVIRDLVGNAGFIYTRT